MRWWNMKLKTSKELVFLVILIPVFLWAAFFVNSKYESNLPSYSIINKSKIGLSIYFEALQELKMPVERTMTAVESSDINRTQILAKGGTFDINSSEIKNWVESGGTIVYLEPGDLHFIDYGVLPEINGNIFVYKYKKGAVIAANASNLTNKALLTNKTDAWNLLKEIDNYSKSGISFNEFYLFDMSVKASLWDYIPLWGKFIFYQILILAGCIFFYKGKRFGKPVLLYEEVERVENEYLYSAAALYRHAGCYDLIFDSLYNNFLSKLDYNHEDWIEYWEKESLPYINKAKRVYEFVQNRNPKTRRREYLQVLEILGHLESIIDKRRDLHWETLKKPL
jgi:hypothetical protein